MPSFCLVRRRRRCDGLSLRLWWKSGGGRGGLNYATSTHCGFAPAAGQPSPVLTFAYRLELAEASSESAYSSYEAVAEREVTCELRLTLFFLRETSR